MIDEAAYSHLVPDSVPPNGTRKPLFEGHFILGRFQFQFQFCMLLKQFTAMEGKYTILNSLKV